MVTPSDNTTHATTLDAHLESVQKMLHELQKSRKQDTLTSLAMTQALQQVHSNFTRDFPLEHSSPIAESSVADLLSGYLQRVQKRNVAVPTGLGSLDNVLNGGFQAKRLVTLLGAPGSGKTSLANQISERVALERPVLYTTSEDVPDVLLAKTLARLGDIPYSAALYGWMDSHEMAIRNAMKVVAERPSAHLLRYLDTTAGAISIDDLRNRAAAHFEGKKGPGLLVIDYLQRMARSIRDLTGKDLREAVTYFTERLRAIACELNCTVLAVASMNRQSGYGKDNEASMLSSAKESGDIEYTCDVVMALIKDTTGKRKTAHFVEPRILRIEKNRQGRVTTLNLDWYADRQKFTPEDEE